MIPSGSMILLSRFELTVIWLFGLLGFFHFLKWIKNMDKKSGMMRERPEPKKKEGVDVVA